MSIGFLIEDNAAVWRFGGFASVLVAGKPTIPLAVVASRYKQPVVAFGKVVSSGWDYLLPLFEFSPPVDASLALHVDGTASLAAVGPEGAVQKTVDGLCRAWGLERVPMQPCFVQENAVRVPFEASNTYLLSSLAKGLKLDAYALWGAAHYAAFLKQYQGMRPRHAMLAACNKFGIRNTRTIDFLVKSEIE